MTRVDAITQRQANADVVRAMGATALYLFRSTAQNDAVTGSDLDLFIDYARAAASTPST